MKPIKDNELDAMLERAGGGDQEWGWYRDDVPRLVYELRQLRYRILEQAYQD